MPKGPSPQLQRAIKAVRLSSSRKGRVERKVHAANVWGQKRSGKVGNSRKNAHRRVKDRMARKYPVMMKGIRN